MQGTRWVLHVDLDQFIAAVEILRRPELAGLPIIVGGRGDPTERAVVSTASYEARAFGVHSGMPLKLAVRKIPDAVFLPVDGPAYDAASAVVMEAVRAHPGAVVQVLGWDEAFVGSVADNAIGLIRRVGPPMCTDALVSMIALPHSNVRFRYATAQSALICGGAKAIGPVIAALPDAPYEGRELVDTVVAEIAKQTPKAEVQNAVRQHLDAGRSRVARWVAIEVLARLKSTEDASKIAALSGAKDRLVGYWGDQSAVPAAERKSDPTLGDRAKELAAQLGAK